MQVSVNYYAEMGPGKLEKSAENAKHSGLSPSSADQGISRNGSLDAVGDDSIHINENTMKKVDVGKRNQQNTNKKNVLLSQQKKVDHQRQAQANEVVGHSLPRARSNIGAVTAQTPMQASQPDISHRSASLHHSVADQQHSQMSYAGSVSLSQLRTHNHDVLAQARANPFPSPNIAKEVLNKPIQKKAYLAAAHSMRPYSNPNKSYYQNKMYTNALRYEQENQNLAE